MSNPFGSMIYGHFRLNVIGSKFRKLNTQVTKHVTMAHRIDLVDAYGSIKHIFRNFG